MMTRLFNVLTALSLLLCVAVAALWSRSHFVHERVRYLPLTVNGTAYDLSYAEAGQTRGVLWVRAGRTVQSRADGDEEDAYHRDHAVRLRNRSWSEGWWVRKPATDFIPNNIHSRWQRTGFGGHADWGGGRWRWWGWGVSVPHWFVALLFAVAPGVRLLRMRRARRRRVLGLCARCGYDLRATPGRCPECGAAARGPTQSTSPPLSDGVVAGSSWGAMGPE